MTPPSTTTNLLTLDPSSTVVGAAWWTGPDQLGACMSCVPARRLPALERIDGMVGSVLKWAKLFHFDHGSFPVVMEFSGGKVHRQMGRIHGLAVLGQAQGALRQALIGAGFDVHTVAENEWTCGKSKPARAREAALIYEKYRAFAGQWDAARDCFKGDPGLDVADAVGLGAFVWRRRQTEQLLARASVKVR